jgi:hypothetical protein
MLQYQVNILNSSLSHLGRGWRSRRQGHCRRCKGQSARRRCRHPRASLLRDAQLLRAFARRPSSHTSCARATRTLSGGSALTRYTRSLNFGQPSPPTASSPVSRLGSCNCAHRRLRGPPAHACATVVGTSSSSLAPPWTQCDTATAMPLPQHLPLARAARRCRRGALAAVDAPRALDCRRRRALTASSVVGDSR